MEMENKVYNIKELANKIKDSDNNVVIAEELKTSERVLSRITDGIYREPSSAIRELIANSYDADATKVIINTDAPRFETIRISDDGIGFTPEALANLIKNIGGSPKRTQKGIEYGISNAEDKNLSPGGRKLIGKIGIGLFALSQITKEFQIITKTINANFRTVADVNLVTHSEIDSEEFKPGSVKIWKVPAIDMDSHGTEIILRNIIPKVRDDLRSLDLWKECKPDYYSEMGGEKNDPKKPPAFHIGSVDLNDPNILSEDPNIPWEKKDKPANRFKQIVDKVYKLCNVQKNYSITENVIFDNYLKTLWLLSLYAPLDYLEKHPFDLEMNEENRYFELSNLQKGQAQEIDLSEGQTIREKLELKSPERGEQHKFKVIIDNIELYRPLRFLGLSKTYDRTPYSLIFYGKDRPDISHIPNEVRGGDLEFEGYLLWNHNIVPKDHTGVLIRINDSSGVLFDETFMHYPVSELTRKKQVTAEIFVLKGLDPALNIDRESFNHSHPHYVYITNWVHNAFRQLATRQKSIAREFRDKQRELETEKRKTELENNIEDRIRGIMNQEDYDIQDVDFYEDQNSVFEEKSKGKLSYHKGIVFSDYPETRSVEQNRKKEEFEIKIKAVAKVLNAFGVLEILSYEEQQKLLKEIVFIFQPDNN